jgi:predicted metal-dependent hydrolase
MAKDLPGFIAQEGAKREGAVIREKNFVDANNYETVAYLKHLDVRNEPKKNRPDASDDQLAMAIGLEKQTCCSGQFPQQT